MKKSTSYFISVAVSLLLCAVALFVPTETGALWQQPCINVYSAFAALFFVMNTVGVIAAARGSCAFAKPYTQERPAIEEKKSHFTAASMAFFEVPLLLTVFFVGGGWKMVACTVLYVGGGLILASLMGDAAVRGMRKDFDEHEQRELAEQRQKEEA